MGGDRIYFNDSIKAGPERHYPFADLLPTMLVWDFIRTCQILCYSWELHDYIDLFILGNKYIDLYEPESEFELEIINEIKKGPINIKNLSNF